MLSLKRAPMALALLALASLIAYACGGGDDKSPSATASSPAVSSTATAAAPRTPGGNTFNVPPEAEEPLAVIQATLDALNRGDIDAAYANLSSDARKEVSLEQVRSVLTGLRSAGIMYELTLDGVDNFNVKGDFADAELTVGVNLGGTKIPVQDEGSMVRENGTWKVADHFIQTALTAVGLYKPPTGTRALDDKGCATGNPMEGVYAPSRLQILDPCITITGTVANDINHAQDGDITFGLILSEADKRLINDVNVANYAGNLHIEIVPFDQGRVPEPKPGDKITVTGPWVTDLAHGHNEIHPAFKIETQ